MARRISVTGAAIAAMILMIFLFSAGQVYAAGDLKLTKTSYDLDEPEELCWSFIHKEQGCAEDISTITVSRPGVVYADSKPRAYDGAYRMQAIGIGDVTLTVSGTEGTVIPVDVHVSAKGLQYVMDELTLIKGMSYGDTKVGIEFIPGSNFELKVGGETFTGAAAVKDQDLTTMWFQLKKMYNAGTKITLTVNNQGCTSTVNDKVLKDTWVEKIKASKKTFSLKTYNLHKGDIVSIKYSGRKYSKKITSNKHQKSYTVKIKVKKKIAKNAKVTFQIKNKYKTSLEKKTVKLRKYTWEPDYDL